MTALPLPTAIARRLDIILAKPVLRRCPRLSESIAALVRDATARRKDVAAPALYLADRHQPAVLAETGSSPGRYCLRCAGKPRWPCTEAEIALQMLRALGHDLPYQVPVTRPVKATGGGTP